MVEVQKLRTFYDICGARATLCGDLRGRGSKTEDFLRFLLAARDPLRRSCAWKRSRCGAVQICLSLGEPSAEIVRVAPCEFVAREMAFGSCLVARAPAFAIPRSRVRFPPGPQQLRLENRSL